MSWVFIDTQRKGHYRLGMIHADGRIEVSLYTGRTRSLLSHLARERVVSGSSWRGVAVVAGPGTFSSIRIGVLYANLLAGLLRLPLYALRVEEAEDKMTLGAWYLRAKQSKRDTGYVAPIYDAEPNITLPKSHPTLSQGHSILSQGHPTLSHKGPPV